MTSADDNHGGVVERPGTPESSTPNHASTPSVSIGVTDIATWDALQVSTRPNVYIEMLPA